MPTYLIPEQNIERLFFQLARLAKKAAKLGQPLTFRKTGRVEDTLVDTTTEVDCAVRKIEVEVDGKPPKIGGWTFVACIQHTTEGNVILAANTELPPVYRTVAPFCEHCRTNRFRRDTFLLANEDREIKQVGRTCLGDFTGHADPLALAELATLLFTVDELCHDAGGDDFYDAGQPAERYSLDTFLVRCAHSILSGAFVSRTTSREQGGEATADTAWGLLNGVDGIAAWRLVTEADRAKAVALAAASRSWVSTEVASKAELNDYEHNLVVVNRGESVSQREAGLAASMIAAYQRDLAKKMRDARLANSQHVGTVGNRLRKLQLEVLAVFDFGESAWGHSYLYSFIDQSGNVMVWKTGGQPIAAGESVVLTGTVKEHTEFRGVKQTALTRCKIES